MNYAKKINALLAKAASTTHEAERDTFTEAAERLMTKWGITDALLESEANHDASHPRETPERRRYVVEGTSNVELARCVVARAARGIGPIRVVYFQGSPVWYAVGFPSDLRRLELYIPHIVEQARSAWRSFRAANREGNYIAGRRSFFIGFGCAVESRLEAMFKAEASSTGAELVLVNRNDSVDGALRELFPHLRSSRSRSVGADAFSAGKQAGVEANLSAGALATAS